MKIELVLFYRDRCRKIITRSDMFLSVWCVNTKRFIRNGFLMRRVSRANVMAVGRVVHVNCGEGGQVQPDHKVT